MRALGAGRTEQPEERDRFRFWLLALVFLLLSIFFTRDVILFIADGTPYGTGDSVMFAWNFWWVAEQLKEGELFFKCDWALLPFGMRTIYHTLIPLHCVVLSPITWVFGPLVSSNLHLILSFAVGALGMALLVRSLTSSYTAGLCGGIVFGFSTTHWYHSFGPYNLTATELLPFCLLFLLQWVRTQRPGALSAASGLLALNLYNGYTSTIILGLALLPVFVLGVVRTVMRQGFKRLLIGLVPAIMLSATIACPLVYYAAEFSSLFDADWGKDYFVAELSSPDLLSYLLPDKNVWFAGTWSEAETLERFVGLGYDCPQFLGIVALVLACFGVRALFGVDRSLLFCILIGIVICAAISLGPEPKVWGRAVVAPELAPFDLLASLPYMDNLRGPGRFGLGVVLLGAVLVGIGAHRLLAMPKSNEAAAVLTVLVACLLFAERVHIPMWTEPISVPALYSRIRDLQPRPQGIVITPFHIWSGHRRVGEFPMFDPAAVLYYQTKHGVPMVNGHASRIPREIEDYYRQAPLSSSLMALQSGESVDVGQMRAEREYVKEITWLFGVSHIVCDYRADYWEAGLPMRTYIEEVLEGEKVYEDETGRIYQLPYPESTVPTRLVITPEDDAARLYLMEGWHKPFVHEGKKRLVFDPYDSDGGVRGRLRLVFRTSEATNKFRYSFQFAPAFPDVFQRTKFRSDMDGKVISRTVCADSQTAAIGGVCDRSFGPGLHCFTLTPLVEASVACSREPSQLPFGLSNRTMLVEKIELDW